MHANQYDNIFLIFMKTYSDELIQDKNILVFDMRLLFFFFSLM